MNSQQRDELGKRVFDNTVFMGRSVKLTNWCDAAAVIETLESLGYMVVPLSEVKEALLSDEMAEYVADWSHAHASEAHQALEGVVEALEDPAFKHALLPTDSEGQS